MTEYSVTALADFLDYAANKGLLNKSTASAKRIAVERVFNVADKNESDDVRAVDISHLMSRFINVAGSGFRPESLASYQSRVKSAIEDFVSWKQSPMTFRPSKRGATKGGKGILPQAPKKSAQRVYNITASTLMVKPSTLSLPIPIRADLTVQINGIPFDLTKAEANKIANVVLAMALEHET